MWPDFRTLGLTHDALSDRRNAIGGSDANVLMSGSESRILKLWQEKRGEAAPEDLTDNLAVQMGLWSEDLNRQWFQIQTGYTVRGNGTVHRNAQYDFMRCTLDGLVHDQAGVKVGIFEAKHCGTRNTDAEIFARYCPQLTHNCIVADERRAWLSAFKGNGDWVMFEYELDDVYAARLVEAERAFWDNVIYGTPPVAVPSEPTPKPVGVREVDMSQSNTWCSYAGDLFETRLQHARYESAKKQLKELVEPDVTKAFGAGVELRRDKRGALRLVFTDGSEGE